MTYLNQSEIAYNSYIYTRVAQAAAEDGEPDPDTWTTTNRRLWAAAPGWADAWASAQVAHADDPLYDPGADEAVITDAMILSQVQAMRSVP